MILLKTMAGRVLVVVKTYTADSCSVLFYLAAVISHKTSLLCDCLALSEVEAQMLCPLPGRVLIDHMSKTLDHSVPPCLSFSKRAKMLSVLGHLCPVFSIHS